MSTFATSPDAVLMDPTDGHPVVGSHLNVWNNDPTVTGASQITDLIQGGNAVPFLVSDANGRFAFSTVNSYMHVYAEDASSNVYRLQADEFNDTVEGFASSYPGVESAATAATAAVADLTVKVNSIPAMVNVANYGYVGDGVADDTSAINAAIAAAPWGSKVVIPPNTTARIGGTVQNLASDGVTLKSVHIDATGANIVTDNPSTVNPTDNFLFQSGYETPLSVSSMSVVSISRATGTLAGIQLTFANSVPSTWGTGSLVKIVADDVIIGALGSTSGSAAARPRVGQTLTVDSVSGNTVVLAGVLFDQNYATNIRAARMQPIPVSWTGGHFRCGPDATNGYSMRFYNSYFPKVSNVVFDNCQDAAIHLWGCYGADVEDVWVAYGPDALGTANGYGVTGAVSENTTVSRCKFGQVRHGFSCGPTSVNAGLSASATDPGMFGNFFKAVVSDCIMDGTADTCFETHTGCVYIAYKNCHARNAGHGFGFRGYYNSIMNCDVTACGDAVFILDDGLDGVSWGHTIDGLAVDGCKDVLYADLGIANPGSVNYGVRIPQSVTVRNVTARQMQAGGMGFRVNNGTFYLENWDIEFGSTTGSSWVNPVTNSNVVADNITWDFKNTTNTSAVPLFQMDSATNSTITSTGMRIRSNNSNLSYIAFDGGSGAQAYRLDNIDMDQVVTVAPASASTANTWIDWKLNGHNASASAGNVLSTIDAGHIAAALDTRDPVVMIQCNVTGTTGNFPEPTFVGQLCVITNALGSGTVVVAQGGSTNVTTASGSNKSLGAGQSVLLQGTTAGWREVAIV